MDQGTSGLAVQINVLRGENLVKKKYILLIIPANYFTLAKPLKGPVHLFYKLTRYYSAALLWFQRGTKNQPFLSFVRAEFNGVVLGDSQKLHVPVEEGVNFNFTCGFECSEVTHTLDDLAQKPVICEWWFCVWVQEMLDVFYAFDGLHCSPSHFSHQ